MNLFRKERPLPKNLIEVNDRLAELRYGNRLRQDSDTAHTLNELVRTVDRLAELVTEPLDLELQAQVDRARQFKVLEVDHRHRSRRPAADGGSRAADRAPSSPAASATSPPPRSSAAMTRATSSRG